MYDLKAHGFDDSLCRIHPKINKEDEGRDFLRTSHLDKDNCPFYLSLCRESKDAVRKLGTRLDFAINRETGAIALYSGKARKLTDSNKRGTVSLVPLREYYRVKYAPFTRLYMNLELHDGVAILTPSGEKQ